MFYFILNKKMFIVIYLKEFIFYFYNYNKNLYNKFKFLRNEYIYFN